MGKGIEETITKVKAELSLTSRLISSRLSPTVTSTSTSMPSKSI